MPHQMKIATSRSWIGFVRHRSVASKYVTGKSRKKSCGRTNSHWTRASRGEERRLSKKQKNPRTTAVQKSSCWWRGDQRERSGDRLMTTKHAAEMTRDRASAISERLSQRHVNGPILHDRVVCFRRVAFQASTTRPTRPITATTTTGPANQIP